MHSEGSIPRAPPPVARSDSLPATDAGSTATVPMATGEGATVDLVPSSALSAAASASSASSLPSASGQRATSGVDIPGSGRMQQERFPSTGVSSRSLAYPSLQGIPVVSAHFM